MLGTIGFLIASAAALFGQEPRVQPGPVFPGSILGPPLIAWSQMQQPRPVPQPLTPDPPEQQQQQAPGQSANSHAQQPEAQTFTGTITKDRTKYVLRESSGTIYQLDDQGSAKQYEGKQVNIVGSLSANAVILHIASIQLIS